MTPAVVPTKARCQRRQQYDNSQRPRRYVGSGTAITETQEKEPRLDGGVLVDLNRSQSYRLYVPNAGDILVLRCRCDGIGCASRARHPGAAIRFTGAVQPVVHDARHDHVVPVRNPAVRRLRERHHAAADWFTGRRIPTPQHVWILAVRLWRHGCGRGFSNPGRGGSLWVVRLCAAEQWSLFA